MTDPFPADLLDRLRWAAPRPTPEDLAAAARHADVVEETVIGLLKIVGRSGILLPEDERLLMLGLLVLAAERRPAARGPLLASIDASDDLWARLFGSSCLSVLGGLLADMTDAPEEALGRFRALAFDTPAWEAALWQVARLVVDDALPAAALDQALAAAMGRRFRKAGSAASIGDLAALLRLPASFAAVRAGLKAIDTDAADALIADLEGLARDGEDPAKVREVFYEMGANPVLDPDFWLGPFDEAAGADMTGRDPAVRAAAPVDGTDLDWLEATLRRVGGGDALTVTEIAGFFCALAVGPLTVPEDEWFEILLAGPDAETVPSFPAPALEERAREIARRLLANHAADVDALVSTVAPEDCPAWASGFLFAVALDDARWTAHLDARGALPFLAALIDASVPPGALPGGRTLDEAGRKTLAERIPRTLAALRAVRDRAERIDPEDLAAVAPVFTKAGRNDPCPCGSGLKFKKCHGR